MSRSKKTIMSKIPSRIRPDLSLTRLRLVDSTEGEGSDLEKCDSNATLSEANKIIV